jgi:hypothetical protein
VSLPTSLLLSSNETTTTAIAPQSAIAVLFGWLQRFQGCEVEHEALDRCLCDFAAVVEADQLLAEFHLNPSQGLYLVL